MSNKKTEYLKSIKMNDATAHIRRRINNASRYCCSLKDVVDDETFEVYVGDDNVILAMLTNSELFVNRLILKEAKKIYPQIINNELVLNDNARSMLNYAFKINFTEIYLIGGGTYANFPTFVRDFPAKIIDSDECTQKKETARTSNSI